MKFYDHEAFTEKQKSKLKRKNRQKKTERFGLERLYLKTKILISSHFYRTV
jgi:hypothetical protein